MTKSELEQAMRNIVIAGDEYDKVDQKSSFDLNIKKQCIRLAKCIAAIANTDSTYFENIGYIILGAKNRQLVGGVDALERDATSANLQVLVGDYIDPPVEFRVERFRDEHAGSWGVIIILPTSETHVFKKKFQELGIREGDIYVRHGDSARLAGKADIDRLQRRKVQESLRVLQDEMRTLRRRIEEQEAQKPVLKMSILDEKNNEHEAVELQPVFWEKTKDQILAHELNEAKIAELEEELNAQSKLTISTQNVKKLSAATKGLKEELYKRKILRYDYYQDDPLRSRIIKLNFLLANNGNAPASGIHFYLYFPTFVELSADFKSFLRNDIENPRLSQTMSMITAFLPSYIDSSQYRPPSPPPPEHIHPKYGGPEIIKRDNEVVASYWTEKLIQHHQHSFDPVFFVSTETDADLKISYRIFVERPPGEFLGDLQLRIRPVRKPRE